MLDEPFFFLDFYDILSQYDESKAVNITYIDFQKAFDKVLHKYLLIKLKITRYPRGRVETVEKTWPNSGKHGV